MTSIIIHPYIHTICLFLITVEIRTSEIPRANLSSLTLWLECLDQLKSFLEDMQSNKTEFQYHSLNPQGDGAHTYHEVPPREKVDQSLVLVDEFERRIETELRKPEKDWNYSAEKNSHDADS